MSVDVQDAMRVVYVETSYNDWNHLIRLTEGRPPPLLLSEKLALITVVFLYM